MAIAVVQNHTVMLMERGGKRRIWELQNVTSIQWGRVRDDISTAIVHVAITEDASANNDVLGTLVGATGRYEIAIWREDSCPWQGPITLAQLNGSDFEIDARDVTHYLERLAMSKIYDNSFPNIDFVTNRIAGIMAFELARKDAAEAPFSIPSCNVAPFIVNHNLTTDAKTSKVTAAYNSYVWAHLDDLAANDGIDYVAIGRAIHLWDTNNPAMGYTPTVTQADFNGKLAFSVYGMELATRSIVTDGQGNWAEADTEVNGGVDPYYGLVETLNNPYTQVDGTTYAAPTLADLTSQADRNLVARNPTPLQVRVPDGSAINMNGVLTLEMLVPGVYLPLVIEEGPFTLSQMQKLASMTVTETATAGETVTVTMGPANDPDAGVP